MKITSLIVLLSLLLAGCGDNTSSPAQAPGNGEVVAAPMPGQQIFELRCTSCHGANGAAGINGATNLRTSSLDSAATFKVVNSGRGALPAFGKMLSAAEIQGLTTYLSILKK